MIIKKIHITNFGKFNDFKYEFEDGLNVFAHENGWGKSTIAAFIKAMLFGMEDKGRKQNVFFDRDHFNPWNGGIYGGTMTFSHKEKVYRIDRTFAEKKKDDKFVLYDEKSNKPCLDFTEIIGEELFNVDLDTFERSVFITLDSEKKPQGSDTITAKLNNLIEDTGDITNFASANEKLDKYSKSNKKYIKDKTIENDHAESEIRNIKSKESIVSTHQTEIDKKRKELNEYKAQQKQLQQQFSASEKYNRKREYQALKNTEKENDEKLKTILDFFNNQTPDENKLLELNKEARSYNENKTLLDKNSILPSEEKEYDQLQTFFCGNIPTNDEIRNCQTDVFEYDKLTKEIASKKLGDIEKTQFELLNSKYGGTNLSNKKIDQFYKEIEEVQSLKNKANHLQSEKQNATNDLNTKKSEKNRNTGRIVSFVLSALFLIASFTGFALKIQIFGIISIIVTIIAFISAIILKSPKKDFTKEENILKKLENQINEIEIRYDEMEKEYTNFIFSIIPNDTSLIRALGTIKSEFEKYENLKTKFENYNLWFKALKVSPEEYEKRILSFTSKYNKNDINNANIFLSTMLANLEKINTYNTKLNNSAENQKKLSKAKELLNIMLANFKTDKTQNYDIQIQECHKNKTILDQLKDTVKQAKEKLVQFEAENDMEEILKAQKPEKETQELESEINNLQSSIESVTKNISEKQTKIDNLLLDIDKIPDLENVIERNKTEIAIKSEHNEILEKTMTNLSKAKIELENNYMDPMKTSFEKYINSLDSKNTFKINSSIAVTIEENGKQYDSQFFSSGYQDLINFSSRLALIDTLYKNESPPVILDDPFINLDSDKINRSAELIKKIAEEKQVIYFICHDSRNIE